MKRLFASLERSGVDYLLISGQASVLYGAAQFSEDVDLWVNPTPNAWRRLLSALESCDALYYKLTPPTTMRYVRGGHGFHFTLPQEEGIPVYLDVMGVPPRVGPFSACRRRARRIETPWGTLPVVSPEDLVLLKLTRRPSDYEVISRLVERRIEETVAARPGLKALKPVHRWAMRYSFDVERLQAYVLLSMIHWPDLLKSDRPVIRAIWAARNRTDVEIRQDKWRQLVAQEMAACQGRDSRYWRVRMNELARLRRDGRLEPEGMPVAP